jgi:hypothetical protein
MLRRRAVQPFAAAAVPEPDGYIIKKSSVTGLPVMFAPARTPRVTPEQIRALLVDFP